MHRFASFLLTAAVVLVGATPSARAADDELVLPLAGLVVDAPERAGAHRVTSTWAFGDFGRFFESRDVIDELDDAGATRGTLWVSVGWFAIGTCSDVVADAPLEGAWQHDRLALWGARWTLRGGIYRGGGAHDGEAAVTACVERGYRKQLVMTRFMSVDRGTPSRAAMLATVRKDGLARRVYRAYHADTVATTTPARMAAVVDHGETPARRDVLMFWTGVSFTLPDDGFIWMTGSELDGIDRFERMAPALPELALSVARLDVDVPCAEALAPIEGGAKPVPGLPAGWEAGPRMTRVGYHSMSVCHRLPGGVLVAAVVTTAEPPSFAPVAPLLEAIRDAIAVKPIAIETDVAATRAPRTRLPAQWHELWRHRVARAVLARAQARARGE